MVHYINKDALVAEIRKRLLPVIRDKHYDELEEGQNSERISILDIIDTLEVIDPYELLVQYPSVKDAIQAHAEDYSWNIESELFQQLTPEQQKLWRKEIEQACISGGYSGLNLAKDPRYKDTLEVKDEEEETVNGDLEEASKKWLKPQLNKSYANYGETKMMELTHFDGYAMLDAIELGANWQRKQDQSTIELAEDHAMLAGMEKMKEQMMKEAAEAKVTARWPLHSSPLYYSYEIYVPYAQHLSEGDNVKILIIKKEDN